MSLPASGLVLGGGLALSLLLTAGIAVGEPPPAPFVEVAAEVGLDFVHFNGMSGELYFAEIAGAGAAFVDYDNDGDLDVFLVQGAMLGEGKTLADAQFPPREGAAEGDRLFRNDLGVGGSETHFVDVTEESGIRSLGYGMGVATGDYDNDGWVDLYITNLGANQLWRNQRDGTFREVSSEVGVGVADWSVSATFLDYDLDGLMDLFVGNYVDFSIRTHKPCFSTSSAREYCGPRSFNPLPDRLFHNLGAEGFRDVSAVSGIASDSGGALGVSSADFNLDGLPDIYVGNDQTPNQLWINQGNGRFLNEAVLAGAAVNVDGVAEASMGVDVADFDGDGDEDIFLAHLSRQTNTIYVNEGNGWFSDQTLGSGLGAPSLSFTAFGTGWIDFDNDGLLDLLVVNGEVKIIESLALEGDPFPLHQTNQLFRQVEVGRFEDVTAAAGPAFRLSEVSRGAAFGDYDNDGDIDVLVANNNGPVRLLRNEIGNSNGWIGLRLLEGALGRDAIGARVAVSLDDGRVLWRRVRSDGSYASANDPRVLVGLGASATVREVRVHWLGGASEVWRDLPLRRYTTLERGEGEPGGDGG